MCMYQNRTGLIKLEVDSICPASGRSVEADGDDNKHGEANRHLQKKGTKQMDPKSKSEQLLSRRQVAARWGCSIATVKRREKGNIIRAVRIGSHARYRLSDLESLEASATIE